MTTDGARGETMGTDELDVAAIHARHAAWHDCMPSRAEWLDDLAAVIVDAQSGNPRAVAVQAAMAHEIAREDVPALLGALAAARADSLAPRPAAPGVSVSAERVEAALVDALDDHLAENASMNAAVSDVLEALAVLGMTVTDAVVIRRDDLLDVEDLGAELVKINHDALNVHRLNSEHDAVWHRAVAIRHLSIAEFADARPPQAEAQVEALSEAIALAAFEDGAGGGRESYPTRLARRLLATGRVSVTHE